MKKLVAFFLFIFLFQQSFCQITNTNVVAKLIVETIDGVSVIIPRAINKTDLYYSLKYEFSIIIQDSTGQPNKESKEDFFVLDPYQIKDFNRLTVNTNMDNKIIVFVLIYDDEDNLLGKDRVVFNDDKEKGKEEEIEKPRDGLVLLGLVTDETKTKFGKDFFDYFYFYYTFNKINGEKVVSIIEERSFGRTTKITVSIEENIVMQFITRPNLEYLEHMAKKTALEVFKYFQKIKQKNTYLKGY